MADTSFEIARVDGVNAADTPPARDDAQDPVLAALHIAEDIYESERRILERSQAALGAARRQLSVADQRQQETQARVEDAEGRLREVENHQLRCQLQAAYLTTITVLADAVETKDAYTGGHFERVARYVRGLGEELGLSARDVSVVYCGGLLHDVGKIGVSDGLLNKPGALLPEEREVIHSHVRLGHDLVSKVPILKDAGDAVLYHHEWFDGNGYPDGLRGEEIPFSARIVAVADSYSAMVDRRSYKEPYSPEQARAELERCGGTQFDPKVVEAFLRVLERGALHEDEDVEDLSFAPLLAVAEPTPT